MSASARIDFGAADQKHSDHVIDVARLVTNRSGYQKNIFRVEITSKGWLEKAQDIWTFNKPAFCLAATMPIFTHALPPIYEFLSNIPMPNPYTLLGRAVVLGAGAALLCSSSARNGAVSVAENVVGGSVSASRSVLRNAVNLAEENNAREALVGSGEYLLSAASAATSFGVQQLPSVGTTLGAIGFILTGSARLICSRGTGRVAHAIFNGSAATLRAGKAALSPLYRLASTTGTIAGEMASQAIHFTGRIVESVTRNAPSLLGMGVLASSAYALYNSRK